MKSWDWTSARRAAPVAHPHVHILADAKRAETAILLVISDPWINLANVAVQPHMDQPDRENYVWQTLLREF